MYNPVSTYRIQFNKEFDFSRLNELISYFKALGISTIYASPVFAAVPGSLHGYDDTDPTQLNPEIGTEEQFLAIRQQLREAGIGWLQDIVPNHMAYHSSNEWLMDMLEKGPLSRYANFFDTALISAFFHGRIQAPVITRPLDGALKNGEIKLCYEQMRFILEANWNKFPLKPGSYATVLKASDEVATNDIQQFLLQLDQLHHNEEPEAYALAWYELREQLAALQHTQSTANYIQKCIDTVNNDLTLLAQLASEQNYRFCPEPETRQEMSYRRFFTVNTLICLNMDDESVFLYTHSLLKKLLETDVVQGLRVDHVDGLFDPTRYLERLRQLAGNETYIVVEKILQATEPLPKWPIQGTSGYDFLALVNNVLTDQRSETAFHDYYHTLVGSDMALPDRIRYRKSFYLSQFMGGELNNLNQYFLDLNLADETALAELTAGELKLAIAELLVACPVYRYYGNTLPLDADETEAIRSLLDSIRENRPELNSALSLLENALLTKPLEGDASYTNRAMHFYKRLMQFSGPLMAKGVEDTLLYTYNRFVGHNEVGDSPERFGISLKTFHEAMQLRQQNWPLAQNATSTHDTKRGEDVRARLNVLTDLANEWLTEVQAWKQTNASLKQVGESGDLVPDANDEYLIYQNLLGAYPMPGQPDDNFAERFQDYVKKALQESKRHAVGWVVDDEYEEGVRQFIETLFDSNRPFWRRFDAFHQRIADFGIVNSLAQLVLKFMCPGVPDIYQGAEGWELSMVDPDNRRPVDFGQRQQWLTNLSARQQSNDQSVWPDLWQHRFDGRIKFWLTHKLLQERQQTASLFLQGDYIPLAVEGAYRDHILAFARQYNKVCYIVVVPLHSAQICQEQRADILGVDWQDTSVVLPATISTNWSNIISGGTGEGTKIPVKNVFTQVPVAVLRVG
ncbi:malto-oligosyltrehalose synthase [Spirosoma sp. SC4-14]|uniref:malto-oligosyltrehalose synthase n=1 Tax=Spirosoma sp. SC4-14 TaxID=3128900 RepID=UPI0030D5D964